VVENKNKKVRTFQSVHMSQSTKSLSGRS